MGGRGISKSALLGLVLKQIVFFKASPLEPYTGSDKNTAALAQSNVSPPDNPPLLLRQITAKEQAHFARNCHLHKPLVLLLLLQLLYEIKLSDMKDQSNKGTTMPRIICCLALFLLVMSTLQLQLVKTKQSELRDFVNALLRLGDVSTLTQAEQPPKSTVEKLAVSYVPCLMLSALALPPVFLVEFHWKDPCRCSLIGYFLLPQCLPMSEGFALHLCILPAWTVSLLASALQVAVVLANLWTWYVGMHAAAFLGAIIYSLSMMMFNDAISRFRIHLQRHRTAAGVAKAARKYREIMVLGNLCSLAQTELLLTVLIAGIVIIAISLPLMLKNVGSESSVIVLVPLGICLFNAIFALMAILHVIVIVYKNSVEALKEVKEKELELWRHCTLENRKLDAKWLKIFRGSSTFVKIKFGSSNYIEELTPLKYFDFAIDLAVQVLLLWEN